MNVLETLLQCEIEWGRAEELPRLLSARFPAAKFLLLADEQTALCVGEAAKRLPKKLMAVVKEDEDVLPLFHAPDGVTCVVGAGRAADAARYFAAVRSLPFVGVCLSSAPAGLAGKTANVRVEGEEVRYPVPPPALVYADEERMKGDKEGIGEACAYIAAAKTALFSWEAAERLALGGEEAAKELFPLCSSAVSAAEAALVVSPFDARSLFEAELAAEYCFANGFPEGEIFSFARAAEKICGGEEGGGQLFACVSSLVKLYALFFESGFYRGGKVDYNARCENAKKLVEGTGIIINQINFPTAEELKIRSERFEEHRETLGERAAVLQKETENLRRVFENSVGKTDQKTDEKRLFGVLRCLPELSLMTNGIAALMRDFSLLEKNANF